VIIGRPRRVTIADEASQSARLPAQRQRALFVRALARTSICTVVGRYSFECRRDQSLLPFCSSLSRCAHFSFVVHSHAVVSLDHVGLSVCQLALPAPRVRAAGHYRCPVLFTLFFFFFSFPRPSWPLFVFTFSFSPPARVSYRRAPTPYGAMQRVLPLLTRPSPSFSCSLSLNTRTRTHTLIFTRASHASVVTRACITGHLLSFYAA
jgi:hypothetical protein